jgi:hypothetical protein
MELLLEVKIGDEKRIKPLLQEAGELTAIFTSTANTAKQNRNKWSFLIADHTFDFRNPTSDLFS